VDWIEPRQEGESRVHPQYQRCGSHREASVHVVSGIR
jgi:hypothetical protein